MTLNTAVDDLSKYCNFFTSFAVVHESGSGKILLQKYFARLSA